MNRLHMRNNTHMVEFPATPSGAMQARAFRAAHPEFARRRIRDMLQLYPAAVPCGVPVEWQRR